VATVPWRLRAVEAALRGKPATEESFAAAASLATEGAKPLAENGFKLTLLPRTIVRALIEVTEGTR
jgi:xanthine dehydrogenase YagS FAD-binding subunit